MSPRKRPPTAAPRVVPVANLTRLAPHVRLAVRTLRDRERALARIFARTDAATMAEAAAALDTFVVELDGPLEGEPDDDCEGEE